MNTNPIKKANLIDMNILKSIKEKCYRENKSTKIYNLLQQHCYKIIIILLCIVFLSYRYISKKAKKEEDEELHQQYIKYKEYKRQKKLQKKLNRLEQSTDKVIPSKPTILEEVNEPMPSNAYSNYVLY